MNRWVAGVARALYEIAVPRARLSLALATALAAGCYTAKPNVPVTSAASHSTAPASVAAAPTPAFVARAHRYHPSGKVPVAARRLTAPPGITARALAVGVRAPDIDLPALVNGKAGRFHLLGALAQKQRVLLVFYRGDW